MGVLRKAVLITAVLFSCVGCDQVTKTVAKSCLVTPQPVYLMGDILRFQYTENTGAFLGLGAQLPETVRFWSFIIFVGLVLLGVLWFIWRSHELNRLSVLGGSLVVGGGFSNLLDRLFNDGAVVDFMNMGVGDLRTGIFNVADMAIMVGVGTLLVGSMLVDELDQEEPSCQGAHADKELVKES